MHFLTKRLLMIPASLELLRAESTDLNEFATRLDAKVPAEWPPENMVDALPLFLAWVEAAPEALGWFGWYALSQAERQLLGCGGFLGPASDGQVQMGYSIMPEFQGQGFATEMAGGLANWAFSQADVMAISAETEWENPASVRVLEKVGFENLGPTETPGGLRFVLAKK